MQKTARVGFVVTMIIGLVVLVSQDPSTIRLDSVMPAGDPKFVDYIAALTASPLTAGDRYEVLINGDHVDPVHYFYNDLTAAEYEKVLELASIENQSLGL